MMLNDENKKDFKKMMKGKAVYIALSVCVLAAGLVSYTNTLQKINKTTNIRETTTPAPHVHIDDRTLTETTTIPTAQPAVTAPSDEVTVSTAPTAESDASPVFDNASPTVADTDGPAQEPVSFSLPLSFRLGDDYSMGVPVFSDTMGDYRTHNGVDFLGEAGTPVKAIAAGTVTAVETSALYGNTVTITHGDGVVSKICGLADEGLIHTGDDVTCDTVIGVVGVVPAEEKEGSHIHLEIRVNGVLADPLEILGIEGAED